MVRVSAISVLLQTLLTLLSDSVVWGAPRYDYHLTISPLEPLVNNDVAYSVTTSYAGLEIGTATMSPSSIAAQSFGRPGRASVQSLYGSNYYIPVQLGTQQFRLLVDTGASDTWVASQNLTCVDSKGKPQAQANCAFPRLYNGSFQYKQIANQNFYVNLGFGTFTQGPVGYMDVTVAGLTVKKQEVALVTRANFDGFGVGSGILGLAYPAQTQVFHGKNIKEDTPKNHAQYPPLFTRMFSDGVINHNMFSMALNRGNSTDGGFVAFGGLPPVPFNKTVYGHTKIHIADLFGFAPAKKHYSLYTIIPKAFGLTGNMTQNTEYFFVDSGTPGIYLPSKSAAEVAKAFKPPAKMTDGAYLAECDAIPPKFSIQIGATTININPKDMIFRRQELPGTGKCLTGIYDGGEGPYVLGDVFLTNIVAVFDVGAAVFRAYPRPY